jgi:hypothetical protein
MPRRGTLTVVESMGEHHHSTHPVGAMRPFASCTRRGTSCALERMTRFKRMKLSYRVTHMLTVGLEHQCSRRPIASLAHWQCATVAQHSCAAQFSLIIIIMLHQAIASTPPAPHHRSATQSVVNAQSNSSTDSNRAGVAAGFNTLKSTAQFARTAVQQGRVQTGPPIVIVRLQIAINPSACSL